MQVTQCDECDIAPTQPRTSGQILVDDKYGLQVEVFFCGGDKDGRAQPDLCGTCFEDVVSKVLTATTDERVKEPVHD